jgi:hypothetical protein
VKLTTHLHLVPRSKCVELHSTNTPSLRGAQLKHRDNFTFTYSFYTDDSVLKGRVRTKLLEVVRSTNREKCEKC